MIQMKNVLLLIFALISATIVNAQTAGTVTFKVTTITAGGQYAPSNIVAIWVTNSSGTFQKSLKVMAAVRKQYLYQWKTATPAQNVVGAITGSTITSHQTHTVSWNCQNSSGTLVPDGDYKIWVEFTEKDGQGPYTSYTFNKGIIGDTLSFSNSANFSNIEISYIPNSSGIEDPAQEASIIRFAGNEAIGFGIPSQKAENAMLQIFDLSGKFVYESADYFDDGAKRFFLWNHTSQNSGVFIYRIESGAEQYCGKFYL